MDRYLTDDRRRKPDGEHLEHPVRVRFTADELEELQASAAMQTGGRVAPYLHDLIMEAHEMRKQRHTQLLADLAEGRPLGEDSREAATQMLQRMAEIGLMRSMDQQLQA